MALVHSTHEPVAGEQFGFAPEQAGCGVYCPLLPQTIGTLPLQVLLPGWHTLH